MRTRGVPVPPRVLVRTCSPLRSRTRSREPTPPKVASPPRRVLPSPPRVPSPPRTRRASPKARRASPPQESRRRRRSTRRSESRRSSRRRHRSVSRSSRRRESRRRSRRRRRSQRKDTAVGSTGGTVEWARRGGELRVPIGENADIEFITQLFDDSKSFFSMHLYEMNCVRIKIVPTEPNRHFLLRGPSNELEMVAKQLDALCVVLPADQETMLKQFEIKETAQEIPPAQLMDVPMKVSTSRIDFTKLAIPAVEPQRDTIKIPPDMVSYVCTAKNIRTLFESTGVEAEYRGSNVIVTGSKTQRVKAQQMLKRVVTHCQWGISESKVDRLLNAPTSLSWALCRLSPMSNLPKYERNLTEGQTMISIGKDTSMDLTIPNSHVSRQHCVIELDVKKNGIYLIDCSTNGTFLNGKRLPAKRSGKVLLSHGDELNLKNPKDDPEFGYIVNFQMC